MASILTSSGITFSDGTTNNGNVRNDIGSLWMTWTSTSCVPGSTIAGSNLAYIHSGTTASAGCTGTWRNHGFNQNNTGEQIYTRVS